jgi:predicted dehydrogenase
VDLYFAGHLRFPGDVTAQFDSGFSAPPRAYMEIVGSKASLSVPQPYKPGKLNSITLFSEEKVERIRVRGNELYLGEVQDMEYAVLDGNAPLISLEHSRANVASIVALLSAAKQGEVVHI